MKTALLALLLLPSPQEEQQTFALTHLRIITVARGEIEDGTLVVKDGKFAEVGKDVKIPAGARVIEARGLVALPGIVQPVSRLGTPGEAPPGGGGSTPHHAAVDEINPTLDIFAQVARTGITTYAVHPAGGVVTGQGALLKPLGNTQDRMVIDRAAFLRINMQANTQAKETIRQAFDAARKAIEAEKKPPSPPPSAPPAAGASGGKPAPATPPPPPAAPPKPDERTQVLIRALKGELPCLVMVSSAGEFLHFWQILDAFSDFKPRISFIATPEAYRAAEELGQRKTRVILRPDLSFTPFTRDRVNPPAELARAGATVAFTPGADGPDALEGYLFRVADLVKYGLSREAALRALTIAPAEMLGVEKRVGSIEAGKDADLLLFDGDPLAPQSRLVRVYINGRPLYSGE